MKIYSILNLIIRVIYIININIILYKFSEGRQICVYFGAEGAMHQDECMMFWLKSSHVSLTDSQWTRLVRTKAGQVKALISAHADSVQTWCLAG